jgi:serpin B
MKKLLYVIIVFIITAGGGLFGQSSPLLGDVNGSGGIDIVDALLTAQYYVGIEPPGFQNSAADVNADGSINIVDALLIAQYYVGLISEFPGQGGGMDVEVIMSGASRNTNPSLQTGELEELVEGNTAFALDFYRTIAGDDDNIIFSPYSISIAFAMCYAGAKGSTDSEIADTLHFTLGQAALHNAFNALDIELAKPGTYIPSGSSGDQFILKISNSTWGQKGLPFVQNFLDTLAINYGAGMNTLDFIADPESSRITINDWVSDHTEQKINDLLPPGSIDQLTRLVLTNAIYFKGSWENKFNPSNTAPVTFTRLDSTTTTADMMKQTIRTTAAEVPGEYIIASIPYYSRKASMILILPDTGRFKAVESSLSPETLSTMISSMKASLLTLSMPKFDFEWGKSIKEVLKNLGMEIPFSSGSDFTGITTAENIWIGDVIHKAIISVDEEGTEAAAATAIIMPSSAPDPLTMTLNRPFIFMIRENVTGTILFAGRVLDP